MKSVLLTLTILISTQAQAATIYCGHPYDAFSLVLNENNEPVRASRSLGYSTNTLDKCATVDENNINCRGSRARLENSNTLHFEAKITSTASGIVVSGKETEITKEGIVSSSTTYTYTDCK